MNVQNLFNQFVGQPNTSPGKPSNLGGFAGGAAAGGLMALLVGNKKARKFAGKAATYGGAAVLGGLAFNALRNWQQNNQSAAQPQASQEQIPTQLSSDFELTLVKTMISAANADGHIDESEQSRIFAALEELKVSESVKSMIIDLVRYPESPEVLARDAKGLEQSSELYLMACFTIDIDTPEERTYLKRLANALSLPEDLTLQLQQQADELVLNAA